MILKIEIQIFIEFYNADNIFNLDIYFTRTHNYLEN
jgi:hypothetical protein